MLDKRIKVKWYQLFSQITNQISSISVIVSSSVWVHHAEVSSFELLDLFCFGFFLFFFSWICPKSPVQFVYVLVNVLVTRLLMKYLVLFSSNDCNPVETFISSRAAAVCVRV